MKVRRTTGAEMQLIKEKLEQEQMAKHVMEMKMRKEEDRKAKELIKRQLEMDKLERQRQVDFVRLMKAEERKNPSIQASAPVQTQPAVQVQTNYAEARIQIRIPNAQPLTKVFQSSDSLKSIIDYVQSTTGKTFRV
jgi:UBX domain-containing protein 1/4